MGFLCSLWLAHVREQELADSINNSFLILGAYLFEYVQKLWYIR